MLFYEATVVRVDFGTLLEELLFHIGLEYVASEQTIVGRLFVQRIGQLLLLLLLQLFQLLLLLLDLVMLLDKELMLLQEKLLLFGQDELFASGRRGCYLSSDLSNGLGQLGINGRWRLRGFECQRFVF